jgi:PAS domain-containing protein
MGTAATASDSPNHRSAAAPRNTSRDILDHLLDQLPLMLSVVDPNGRYQLVNRLWVRTYGWMLHEIAANHLDVLAYCFPDPQERERVRRFSAEARGEWATFTPRVRDGRVLHTTWCNIRLGDGTSVRIGHEVGAHPPISVERVRLLAEVVGTQIVSSSSESSPCPRCGIHYRTRGRMLGDTIYCPGCGGHLLLTLSERGVVLRLHKAQDGCL